jgi:subtilisin family serine protease
VIGVVKGTNGHSDQDTFGMATEVSEVLAAKGNTYAAAGIAPGASLWAVRALNTDGNCHLATILCDVELGCDKDRGRREPVSSHRTSVNPTAKGAWRPVGCL